MAELVITDAVGAPPAPNRTEDVRTVQSLLTRVVPAVSAPPAVTGSIDDVTTRAIREFQRRFMANPDGRVDPDGRTLWHLNDGFVSQYIRCNPTQRKILDRDIIDSQKWLDTVIRLLEATDMDADTKRKVRNVFHVNVDESSERPRLVTLRQRFRRLRASMDEPFPLQCEQRASLFAAWVVEGDATGTMHFPSTHFQQNPESRHETIIHERAHTVFSISHAGMAGAGELNFAQGPDDDNGFSHSDAMANAYCYGWLSRALQPGYVRPDSGMEIIVPRPHGGGSSAGGVR